MLWISFEVSQGSFEVFLCDWLGSSVAILCIMVCPWPFMASLDSGVASVKPPQSGKSFVHALSGPTDYQLTKLPPKFVMGKSVCVTITEDEYEAGIVNCCSNIHGRLTLRKGDSPLTTLALKLKLSKLLPNIKNWELTPLVRDFSSFISIRLMT